jgi:two-component system NtrC family sensor kinase
MAATKILLIHPDPSFGLQLERTVFPPPEYLLTLASRLPEVADLLAQDPQDVVLLAEPLDGSDSLAVAAHLLAYDPSLPIIFLPARHDPERALAALRVGVADYVLPPAAPADLHRALATGLARRARWDAWVHSQAGRSTRSLQQRLHGMEAMQRVSQHVTASLEGERVMHAVVGAAVALTHAEEGSLLLLDETSGELYIQAAQNYPEEFVRTFRLPVSDSLAGEVLHTQQPILINEDTPRKIQTAYLVRTLIYVPLVVGERAIGVLGVDNRAAGKPLTAADVETLAALAQYAGIAIENARLHARTEAERTQLETILAQLEESVLVLDPQDRILLINRKARQTFGLDETENLVGQPVGRLGSADLDNALSAESRSGTPRLEVSLPDGRVLNAQLTPIPALGLALTMQDITHLKELDRIKSDFVNTVSHDLRSPLTAILGYVELIERVGPTTPQQSEFIRRVEVNVHNITFLINDLLDLGRIEAGFDVRKEITSLAALVELTVDGLRGRFSEREQQVILDFPLALPPVLGNPIQLRQMVANLVGNAVKYTPAGGKIVVGLRAEEQQLIFQVQDDGPGIPGPDQPYIFDKFYRGSNIPGEIPGTGLGLAIVKSIVDSHQGRVWVESSPERGTTFTVVLPAMTAAE